MDAENVQERVGCSVNVRNCEYQLEPKMAVELPCYTVINDVDDNEPPTESQLRADLGIC